MERDDLIRYYSQSGYKHKEICSFLEGLHGISISPRYLKKLIRKLELHRYGQQSPLELIINVIQFELNGGSGLGCGYRSMHKRLTTQHNLKVSRYTVQMLMQIMDSEGVELRKRRKLKRRKYVSRGPNFAIHVDGYDKIKYFGFCIHGAIDGFSRKIIWLSVATTNNNPKVVAKYYLDFVKEIKGVPRLVRFDNGTENANIEQIQVILRWDHGDQMEGAKSILYGKSTSNQRIERWWGSLRPYIQPYINIFKDLQDLGIYNPCDDIEKSCMQFCFMQLIQNELDRVQMWWNQHRIREVKTHTETIGGIPDMLYLLPEQFGGRDYKFPVDVNTLDWIEEEFCTNPPRCCSNLELVYEAARQLNGWTMPKDCDEALTLYASLADFCFQDLR